MRAEPFDKLRTAPVEARGCALRRVQGAFNPAIAEAVTPIARSDRVA
jgi:hypothetical protein